MKISSIKLFLIITTLTFIVDGVVNGNALIEAENANGKSLEFLHLNDIRQTLLRSHWFSSLTRPANEVRLPEASYIVPLKIHFIWLGSFIPDKYMNNILTYKQNNKHYEINLWTDNEKMTSSHAIKGIHIRDIGTLQFLNRDFFDAELNYGYKSDLLRYEIIYQEGGIYTDTDCVSLKPFDGNFTHSFLFYMNITVPVLKRYVTNTCFGFPKKSNFLLFLIKTLRKNFDWSLSGLRRNGGPFLTTCFVHYNDSNINLMTEDILAIPGHAYSMHNLDATWVKQVQDALWWRKAKICAAVAGVVLFTGIVVDLYVKTQKRKRVRSCLSRVVSFKDC